MCIPHSYCVQISSHIIQLSVGSFKTSVIQVELEYMMEYMVYIQEVNGLQGERPKQHVWTKACEG